MLIVMIFTYMNNILNILYIYVYIYICLRLFGKGIRLSEINFIPFIMFV